MKNKNANKPAVKTQQQVKTRVVGGIVAGIVALAGILAITQTQQTTGAPSFANVATDDAGNAGSVLAQSSNKEGGFAWGDINNDGCLDLVVNTFTKSPGTRIFISDCNLPNPTYSDQTSTLCSSCDDSGKGQNQERTTMLADINHDGYVDLMYGGNGLFYIHANSGPPSYSYGSYDFRINWDISGGTNFEGVALIDYDNDGWLDLVFENHNYGIDLYENPKDGSVNFTYKDPNTVGLPTSAADGDYLTVADYDNDGDVDILARKRNAEDFFKNNGDGTFASGVNLGDANNGNKGGVLFADFDNDGDLDAYWTDSGTDQIWLNENGTLTQTSNGATGEPWASAGITPPTGNEGCAAGDVNNDGKIDLFIGASSGSSYLFINNTPDGGALSFTQNNYGINLNGNAEGVSFGDYDNDGDLDLYVNIASGGNQLWRNGLNDNNYLIVEAQKDLGSGVTRAALGANIVLKNCQGAVLSGIRDVPSTSGQGTDAPDAVHFGLPNGPDQTYLVEVSFVTENGTRAIVQKLVTPSQLTDQKIVIKDTDESFLANCEIFTDADNDGITNLNDRDDDNDGIPDVHEIYKGDHDNDGMPDYEDPEFCAATFAPLGYTCGGELPEPSGDLDGDGIPNMSDSDFPGCGTLVNGICSNFDTDKDGIPDHLDLDSDNDGITDLVEVGGADTDGDGRADCEASNQTYTVALTVTDNEGCTTTHAGTVTVGNSPAASFDPAGTTGTTCAGGSTPCSCQGDGKLLLDIYTGISGSSVSDLTGSSNYPNNPTATVVRTIFEGPKDSLDGYGCRLRGWICPPTSGNYTFYIASDDHSELWLSTDETSANKQKIAEVNSWTGSRQWDKYSSQTSSAFALTAGQTYYVEALVKDGGGGDNLAVGWKLPDGTYDRPISGTYLSSTQPTEGCNEAPTAIISVTSNSGSGPYTVVFSGNNSADPDGSIASYAWDFGDGSTGTGATPSHSYAITTQEDTDDDGWCNTYDNIGGSFSDGTPMSILDTDGDGIPNQLDLDADNDGIPDLVEAGGEDSDGDGRVDSAAPNGELSSDTDFDGLADSVDPDLNNDGDTHDPGDTGLPLAITGQGNSNGLATSYPAFDNDASGSTHPVSVDIDGDGVPNFYDLDSDNDGIPDLVEVGGTDVNADGKVDALSNDNTFSTGNDDDKDGFWDSYDPDDNTTDTDEAEVNQPLIKSVASGSGPEDGHPALADLEGKTALIGGANVDFDGDGIPNYLDLDSDDDGILDVVEGGFGTNAVNGMLASSGASDSNGDGWNDDATGDIVASADNSGTEISNNTLPDFATGEGNVDVDGDGLPNWLDLDADNDGIVDNIEGQETSDFQPPAPGTDTDFDGVMDTYDSNSDFAAAGISPAYFSDGDATPDYLDTDTDNDGISDYDEAWDGPDGDDTADGTFAGACLSTDADLDGLLDCFDAFTSGSNAKSPVGFNTPPNDSDGSSKMTSNGVLPGSNFTPDFIFPTNPGQGVYLTQPDWRDNGLTFAVEWLNFSAYLEGGNGILEWATATENKSDFFEIQRSVNGENFTRIGETTATGTTSDISEYTFTDTDVTSLGLKRMFYRLKEVDTEGQNSFSNVVELRMDQGANLSLIAYPNPTSNRANISFVGAEPQDVTLRVVDLSGKVLINETFNEFSGKKELSIDISTWSAGLYMVHVFGESSQQQTKLMVQ
ncbi:MAG: FG-GAP-like repeat-containing protein [Bacteroidota bacterium]